EKKLVSLDEYVSRMPEDQKYIFCAAGESNEGIEKLPKTELVAGKGYEILYFTDEFDEFEIKMLTEYEGKEFGYVLSSNLGIDTEEESKKAKEEEHEHKDMFAEMKELLSGKVSDVKVSKRLKSHPVCLSADGEISLEMEKVLNAMPNN